jgi:hypothetical protein
MSEKANATSSCPFCTLPAERIIQENEHAALVLDAYPVSQGHSLIMPKVHNLVKTADQRNNLTIRELTTNLIFQLSRFFLRFLWHFLFEIAQLSTGG